MNSKEKINIYTLKLATYNIRNTTDEYEFRKKLFPKIISQINPDIIGFQEVNFLGLNQLNDLFHNQEARELFTHFKAKTQLDYKETNDIKDKAFQIDGNALLARKSFLESSDLINHQVLHLSPIRNCQLLSFNLKEIKVNVINLHLHHLETEEVIRVHQMKCILKWIEKISNAEDLNIILGDFNCDPNSDTYRLIKQFNYKSCYFERNGKEPENTFHNKMDCPSKDASDEMTCDYIFYLNKSGNINIKINSVALFGMEDSTERKGIYASDHFALSAEIEIYQNSFK